MNARNAVLLRGGALPPEQPISARAAAEARAAGRLREPSGAALARLPLSE